MKFARLNDGPTQEEIEIKQALRQEQLANYTTKVASKREEIVRDYDISDMNSNDGLVLQAMAQALVSLEDYEHQAMDLRLEGVTMDNIMLIEKLSKVMSDLRGDISKMQDDLKISRKVRKSDKDATVVSFIDDLKKKAKEFYDARMAYVLCPDCNVVLGTMWVLYPDNDNRFTFNCTRKLDEGVICKGKITVTSKELWSKKGTNKPEMMPESML